MDSQLNKSRISRTRSLLGSFKMTDSLFVSDGNKKVLNLEIKGLKLIDKTHYRKQETCQVCFIKFNKFTRQHHCRVCANAVCSGCSPSSINKERVCDVCAWKHSDENREREKEKILAELKGAAIMYIQNRNKVEVEVKELTNQQKDQDMDLLRQKSGKKLAELNARLQQLRGQNQRLEMELKN